MRVILAIAAATEGLQRRCTHLDSLYRGAREDADRLEGQIAERTELNRVVGTDQPAEARYRSSGWPPVAATYLVTVLIFRP
jgi:hypothetical protein